MASPPLCIGAGEGEGEAREGGPEEEVGVEGRWWVKWA